MEEGTTTAEVNETSEVPANHNSPMCLICNVKFKMPTTPEELDMLIHSQEELSQIEECFALNFDISAEEREEVSFFNQPDLIPFCTSCSQLVKRLHAEQVALLELVQKFNKTREDIVTILVYTFLVRFTTDHPFFNMKNLIYEKWTKNRKNRMDEEDLGEEAYEEETVEPTLLIEDSNEDAETRIQHSLQNMTAEEILAEGVASAVQPTNKKKPEEVMIGMETVETEEISQLTPTSETAAVEEVAAASTDTVQPPQQPSETVEKETAPPPKKRRRKGPFLTYRTRSKARVPQRKVRNKSNSSPPTPLLQKEDKEKEKSNTETQAKVPLSPPVLHRTDCTENESPNPDESNKGFENHPKTVKLPNDFAQDSINADSAIIEQAQTNYPGFKDLNFNSAVLAEPIEIVEPSSEAEPVKDKESFCSSEKAPNKASKIKDNSTQKTRKIYGPKSKLEGIRARVLAIESRIHKIQSNNIEKNRKVMRAKPGSGSEPLRHTKAKARLVEPLLPSPTKSNSANIPEIVSLSPCTSPNPPVLVPLTTPNTSEVKKPGLKTYDPKSKQASQNVQIKKPLVPFPVTEIHKPPQCEQDGSNDITEKSGRDKLNNRIIIKRVNHSSKPTWRVFEHQNMNAEMIFTEGDASTVLPQNRKEPEEVMIGMETAETEDTSQLMPTSETIVVELEKEVATAFTEFVQSQPAETVEPETSPPPKKKRRKGPLLAYRTRKARIRDQQRRLVTNKSNLSLPPPLLPNEVCTSEVSTRQNSMCLVCNEEFKMPTTPEELDLLIHNPDELLQVEECFAANFGISAEELDEVSLFNQPDLVPFCAKCSQLAKRLFTEQVEELTENFIKTKDKIADILFRTFVNTTDQDHPFFNMKNLIYEKLTNTCEEDFVEETHDEETFEDTF